MCNDFNNVRDKNKCYETLDFDFLNFKKAKERTTGK